VLCLGPAFPFAAFSDSKESAHAGRTNTNKDLPKHPAGLSLRWYLATWPLYFGIRHGGLKAKQEVVGRGAAEKGIKAGLRG
jgi:hypothetical protein